MSKGKFGNQYPAEEPMEENKYLPSFFLVVEIDKQIIHAEIRPLRRDTGYFTIILNSIFLGHIHKAGIFWVDFLGQNMELYQKVGKLIEEHLEATG